MKYIGSKTRIKKDIVPILQKIIDTYNIDTYIDAFCGGCNIIDEIKCKNRYANDISSPLIAMWKSLLLGNKPPTALSKEIYDLIKNSYKNKDNKYSLDYVGFAGYLATYNAKFFGGYAKITLTKTGITRNYYDESCRNILKQVPKLKNVIFTNKDYSELKYTNSLIYCDIPYKDTTQYDVSKNFDYDRFWNWASDMSKDNIVIISELQAPDSFVEIWSQNVKRTLDNKSRTTSLEKLFVHKLQYDKIKDILQK